jgi:uncharacterized protein (DUF305 family)
MMQRCVAVLAACALLLAGCDRGTDRAAPAAAAAPRFNDTDVMFLQMMIPHHREGLEIVRLAKERAVDAEVRTLAAAIDSTQASEVESMTGWLRDWGKPAKVDTNPSLHAGHGGMRATGAARIAELRKASRSDFDRTFLNLLIGHQHNAIELARMETSGGMNLQATALARRIDESRTAEISMMLRYLA